MPPNPTSDWTELHVSETYIRIIALFKQKEEEKEKEIYILNSIYSFSFVNIRIVFIGMRQYIVFSQQELSLD